MKKKIISYILLFSMVFITFLNFSISVLCDENFNIGDRTDFENMGEREPIKWSEEDTIRFTGYVFTRALPLEFGFIFGDVSWDEFVREVSLQDICEQHGITYDEFITNKKAFYRVFINDKSPYSGGGGGGGHSYGNIKPEDIIAPTDSNTTTLKMLDSIQIEFSDEFMDIAEEAINNYVDSCGFWYMETTPISNFRNLSMFSNKASYNAVENFLKRNDDKLCFLRPHKFTTNKTNDGYSRIASYFGVVELDFDGIVGSQSFNMGDFNINVCHVCKDWVKPTYIKFTSYDFIIDTGEFRAYENCDMRNDFDFTPDSTWRFNDNYKWTSSDGEIPVSINRKKFKVYKSMDDYKDATVGLSPYYTCEPKELGSSFSARDMASLINNGSITTYYNNYYGINGHYPTDDEIQDFIDKYMNEYDKNNKNSDKDKSTDDSDSDFSFFGTIGKALGSLISAIGSLLSGIVDGLVDAITSLLNGISGLIETIVGGLPTAFSQFLSSLLGFLPEEIVALITLSITAMILVGIIRLIRG